MNNRFGPGRIAELLATPIGIALILAQFIIVIALSYSYQARRSSDGCIGCHADRQKMTADGYPQFYMTREQVERESRMPGAVCVDCHLGDGATDDRDKAHKGMLRLLVYDQDLNRIPRKGKVDRLLPEGSDRLYAMFPKVDDGKGNRVPDPDIFTILWHDRDPDTLAYDPRLAEKTCGRSGCHPQEVMQFGKTVMGGNVRQRSMRHWTDVHGPNNCGPSFADLPPGTGAASGLSEANYKIIKDDLSCPSSYRNASDRQRFCNVCHAGCLDCHYRPTAKEGVHAFTRKVPAENCTGGGRGTGMCHSGSQERRRGDSYLGNEISEPAGMTPDVHRKKGMECMDCHVTGEKGMGDMQRAVDCEGCHYSVVKAHGAGVHKGLRCQACHIGTLGGYQMTVWGKGHVSGRETPFKKYSLYFGTLEYPVIMKDREGLYTPYKVWPNIATNMLKAEPKRDGISWRWPTGETRDGYAFLGTFPTKTAGLALAWLQLESVGHPLGKSRSCGSCHDSTAQRLKSRWEYKGFSGSDPFLGAQEVTADASGLRITGVREVTPMRLLGDAGVEDFAAWKTLGDVYDTKGDFSIPKADPAKYGEYLAARKEFDAMLAAAKKAGTDEKMLARVRAVGEHDPAAGIIEIENRRKQ